MSEKIRPSLRSQVQELRPPLYTGTQTGDRALRFHQPAHSSSSLSRRLSSPLVRVVDLTALSGALFLTLLSLYVRHGESLGSFLGRRISLRDVGIEAALLLGWRCMFWIAGLYQPRLNRSLDVFLWKIPVTNLGCAALVLPLLLHDRAGEDLLLHLALFWFMASTLMLVNRSVVSAYEEHLRPLLRPSRTVLICGTGPLACLLARQLPTDPEYRYHLAGFIDSDPQFECRRLGPVLGSLDDFEATLMREPIDEVMVALPVKSHFSEIQRIVTACGRAGVRAQYSFDFFSTDVAKHRSVDTAEGSRVVFEMVHQDHRLLVKGVLDRIAAGIALVILSPLLLLIAVAIKVTSHGPVFFLQQRFGLGKRTFRMIKFRSMVSDAEARQAELEHRNEYNGPTFKIRRDPRITGIGSFLRRTSLDELPQLINVLKGDMSLVGPRPLPVRDVQRFSEPWLMRRFSVKPGITGLWQVSGRSYEDFNQAIKLDLRYIDRWTLALDIKILFQTLAAVIQGRGAY